MFQIIEDVRFNLIEFSEENRRISGKKFFKEEVHIYGVKMPVVHEISQTHFKKLIHLNKYEIFNVCELLFQSGYLEESIVACNWAYNVRKKFEPEDLKIFEEWIQKYITNWASCDTLCNHTMGIFFEKFPDYISELKKYAESENRWMRRASAVSLIVPARKGLFLDDILEIADILLTDTDDLVRKGYGWMLKTASEYHLQAIYNYVMKNKKIMPRTSLRYAIEKMPEYMRTEVMKK